MKARLNWMSIMGGTHVDIDAEVNPIAETVLVDADTLATMAESVLREGPVDVWGNIGMAHAILSVEAGVDGLFDVTEVGGGWDRWTQDFDLEALTPVRYAVWWTDFVANEWVAVVAGDYRTADGLESLRRAGKDTDSFGMNVIRLTGNIGSDDIKVTATHTADEFFALDWGVECGCGHPFHVGRCKGTWGSMSDGDTVQMGIVQGTDPNMPCVCDEWSNPA